MTARERVNSPDELRAGDRVEVGDDGWGRLRGFVVIDVLYRAGDWWGFVVDASSGTLHSTTQGCLIHVGQLACIFADNYPAGRVFVRRRSREGQAVSRAREVQR